MAAEQVVEEPRWRKAGEPIQYTRDELLAEARRLGATLSPRQFRTWAELGLLPAPLRRIPPAATDKVVRALYPGWTLALILNLDEHIGQGTKLTELKGFADREMHRLRDMGRIELPEVRPRDAIWPRIPRALQRAVWDYVARFEENIDDPGVVQSSQLTIQLATGVPIVIPIGKPPAKGDDHLPEI